jgi:hypothetical protein
MGYNEILTPCCLPAFTIILMRLNQSQYLTVTLSAIHLTLKTTSNLNVQLRCALSKN